MSPRSVAKEPFTALSTFSQRRRLGLVDEGLEPVTFDRDGRILRYAECGDFSMGRAEGWRLALDCDEELAAFCPECWAAEFGDE